ncbi:uncharacterized protein LOC134247396 [Saccostrea cucullata]|uniref:uncharacterized protein LOC134247396 n=1 Tax=Saccostrea cuccullata TaxID=36930 RepID=UPI002ED6B906
MVLPRYTPALTPNNIPKEELVTRYFQQGYTNTEILQLIRTVHKVKISKSHLKRILRNLGLKRRPGDVDLFHIVNAILDITENSGQCLGYRAIWKRLITDYGFVVQRAKIMELMRIIDPDGVERRKHRRLLRRQYAAPGPNFIWHIDGYDKLKPFGFAVHGAIDGFSRRILWLEVGPSNNNPKIISRYFLDTVQQLGCCPNVCRCDLGTENKELEEIQVLLHSLQDQDYGNCFLYGKSTSNQRIEAWWSILRRQAADWWITFFKDLRDTNVFNDGDHLHIECLRYCFMAVLQEELHQIVIQWNQHRMQVKKESNSPKGKPDVLFFTPESYGAQNFKIDCHPEDIIYCQEHYGEDRPMHGCSGEFLELANLILPNHQRPSNINEAADLFGQFITIFNGYTA